MTHRNDIYTKRHRHPPIADKTICIDFDGTVLPWGPLNRRRPPFPGAIEALTSLRAAGYHIVILTARLSDTWWQAEALSRGVDVVAFGRQQTDFVVGTLGFYGVPYDLVTAEKVPALAYIDDKALRVVSEPGSLADVVAEFLRSEEAAA